MNTIVGVLAILYAVSLIALLIIGHSFLSCYCSESTQFINFAVWSLEVYLTKSSEYAIFYEILFFIEGVRIDQNKIHLGHCNSMCYPFNFTNNVRTPKTALASGYFCSGT